MSFSVERKAHKDRKYRLLQKKKREAMGNIFNLLGYNDAYQQEAFTRDMNNYISSTYGIEIYSNKFRFRSPPFTEGV